MIRAALMAFLLMLAPLSWAQSLTAEEEARAKDLGRALRCLVCQNQSLEDSDADLARDLKLILRERIAAGDTDEQIFAFMTARYGDWILMQPPVKSTTALLWIGPFLLLVGAGIGVALFIIRLGRMRNSAPPLSESEKQELSHLIQDEGEPRP